MDLVVLTVPTIFAEPAVIVILIKIVSVSQNEKARGIRYRGFHGLTYSIFSDPYGTRTRVAAVKGRCPRPLDEGAKSQTAGDIPAETATPSEF